MKKTRSCLSRGKREGVVPSRLCLGRLSELILRQYSAGSWLGSDEKIVARVSFLGNGFRTLQELHRSDKV